MLCHNTSWEPHWKSGVTPPAPLSQAPMLRWLPLANCGQLRLRLSILPCTRLAVLKCLPTCLRFTAFQRVPSLLFPMSSLCTAARLLVSKCKACLLKGLSWNVLSLSSVFNSTPVAQKSPWSAVGAGLGLEGDAQGSIQESRVERQHVQLTLCSPGLVEVLDMRAVLTFYAC